MAKEWASVLKDAETREVAEEAAEIVLRQGFDLPRLKPDNLGGKKKRGLVMANYNATSNMITVNTNAAIKRAGGMRRAMQDAVKWGESSQDNVILHELSHYIDSVVNPEYNHVEHNWGIDLDRKYVKKELSGYATTNRAEFEAELISAILRGKTFPKEIMEYAEFGKQKDERVKPIYQAGIGEIPNTFGLPRKFDNMMEALHQEQGNALKPEILTKKAVTEFIEQHTRILDNAVDYTIRQRPMDNISVQRLKESNYVFSGFKAFHELNEAFPSLLDADGSRKPFEQFLNEVQTIDESYNKNYLKAEYNFAVATSQMAAKWEKFVADGDRYYLQYRTANDDLVRDSHAKLHNVTLPVSSPFWDEYFPPNGWGCRCTVVQVRKSKYALSDERKAIADGNQATAGKHQELFRFNPGKSQACYPDYNPYTIKKCATCSKSGFKLVKMPNNDLCAACRVIREMKKELEKTRKQYEAYDEKRWEKEFYDSKNGGYLVTEKKRIEAGEVNKQEKAKYDKEHKMCEVFAKAGYRVEYWGETSGISSSDVTINGVPADLKRTKGSGNIVKYAKKAVRRQGAKIALFQFDDWDDTFREQLLVLKNLRIKVKYFITDDEQVHSL